MNIKIKSAGVTCLVGDDYDRVFTALKSNFGESYDQLFTERIPGHEYLQWELPGEGWTPLSASDPIMGQEVRTELARRKQAVFDRFGANQEYAQRILSVPDDSYIYYKADPDGRLMIKLTAWGYRYPERVGTGASGIVDATGETEPVTLHFLYDGKPMSVFQFFLNDFKRTTDADGTFKIGQLPVGYTFDVRAANHSETVRVTPGQGDVNIDLTDYVTIEVVATLDGAPYAGAKAELSYWGHSVELITGATGRAVTKVPFDPENGVGYVTLDGVNLQMPVTQPKTVFSFAIESPAPEIVDDDDNADENINDVEDETAEDTVIDNGNADDAVDDNQDNTLDEEITDDNEENEETQKKPDEDDLVPEKPGVSLIWLILAGLGLAILVAATYYLSYNFLTR